MKREGKPSRRLNYEVAGNGPPILFLHGLGMSRQVWEPIVQTFQNEFQCITLDMYGFGTNKASEEIQHIPFDYWINEIQDIIQTLDFTQIHLAGHSLGSMIALAYAAQFPSQCLSVTAISTLPEFGQAITDAFEQRAQKVEKLGLDSIINDLIHGGFSEETIKNNPAVIEQYRTIVSQNTSSQYALACRSAANLSIKPLLEQITMPVQLLVGLEDKVTPPVLTESVYRLLPERKMYTTLKDCGHQIHMEKPEEVAKIIHDFLYKNFGRNDK